jgi:hypothetical protein
MTKIFFEDCLIPPSTQLAELLLSSAFWMDKSWKRRSILLPPWTGSSKVCPPTRDNRDRSLGTGRRKLSSSHHGQVLKRFVLLLEITEI